MTPVDGRGVPFCAEEAGVVWIDLTKRKSEIIIAITEKISIALSACFLSLIAPPE